MFCKQCGAQIDDNTKFCTACGAKIENDSNVGEVMDTSIVYNQEAKSAENSINNSRLGEIINGIISLIAIVYLIASLVGKSDKSPIPFLIFIGIVVLIGMIEEKFPKIPKALVYAVEIIILIVCINSANSLGVVNLVKKSTHDGYPDITYEEAFENFFDNPEWKRAGKDEEGNKLVKFTGECTYSDEAASVVITFTLYDDTFTVSSLKMNGQELGLFLTELMIEKVFEEYD